MQGGKKITGRIKIQGSKNAALPIIAASILLKEKAVLKNVPDISDVLSFIEILKKLGAKTEYKNNILIIDNSEIKNKKIKSKQAKKSRASFLFYGALLSLFGKAKMIKTGGCKIGKRPLDIHKKAFKEIKKGKREIFLGSPSVGATENLLIYMAGKSEKNIKRKGRVEQEVWDLGVFFGKGGGKKKGKKRGKENFYRLTCCPSPPSLLKWEVGGGVVLRGFLFFLRGGFLGFFFFLLLRSFRQQGGGLLAVCR
ncbi:hypothetical protein [Treponema sp. R6D11]